MSFKILDLSGETDMDNPALTLQELIERYSIKPDVHFLRVYKKERKKWVRRIVQITPMYGNYSRVDISIKKEDGSFYPNPNRTRTNADYNSILHALHELGLFMAIPRNKTPKPVMPR